jgi:carboxylesterase type B
LLDSATTAAAAVKKTADIEYASVAGQALRLDLYEPEGISSAPLLVWVHGGAWEAGSKSAMPATASPCTR